MVSKFLSPFKISMGKSLTPCLHNVQQILSLIDWNHCVPKVSCEFMLIGNVALVQHRGQDWWITWSSAVIYGGRSYQKRLLDGRVAQILVIRRVKKREPQCHLVSQPPPVPAGNGEKLLASQQIRCSTGERHAEGTGWEDVRRKGENTLDTPYLTEPTPVQQNSFITPKCLSVVWPSYEDNMYEQYNWDSLSLEE